MKKQLTIGLLLILFSVMVSVMFVVALESETELDKAMRDLNHNYDLLDRQIVDLEFDTSAEPVVLYYDDVGVAIFISYGARDAEVRVYRHFDSQYALPTYYEPISMLFTQPFGCSRVIKKVD